jgi:C-8 sterol isomerase
VDEPRAGLLAFSPMAHLFEPEELEAIVRRSMGLPWERMVDQIIQDLAAAYPGHIHTRQEWIMNLVGGAAGMMHILHGSLSEYLLLFGSAIGTGGFSGRYHLDIWDTMLCGEMRTFTEAAPSQAVTHRPGETAHLPRRTAKVYQTTPGAWMLEYGRGAIITALPIGISGAVTSLEPRTIVRTLRCYGQRVVGSLLKGKL